jgi:hypothetical protein
MTDLNDLRRKAQAAREFLVHEGGAVFTLRLPTAHETDIEALRARSEESASAAQGVLLMRRLLEKAVVAWQGVIGELLAPQGGSDAVELSPEAVGLLLDNRPDIAATLYAAFVERAAARTAAREQAAKN